MKTLVLIFSAVLLMDFSSYGQPGKAVPANVTDAFSRKFPAATKVEWGRESEKEWEAEFRMDGKEYSANFDNSGIWAETEYELTTKEIPAPVKAALDKESAGFKIKECAVSETVEAKLYEFVLSKGKEKLEVVIDPSGKVVTKELVTKEKEDKEEED
jgi:hypothetical protein